MAETCMFLPFLLMASNCLISLVEHQVVMFSWDVGCLVQSVVVWYTLTGTC